MAITNPYYEFTPEFTPGTKARAEDVNRQYQAIQTAFDFLPGAADAIVTGTATFAPETGTGNAYVVTMPDTRTSNQDGDQVVFYATHTNTGAATLAVDAIGAVNFVNWDGDPFTGGEIVSGRLYSVRYDATGVRFVLEATIDAALQVEWAEEWAQQLEDVPVSVAAGGDGVTDFSAYHWAQKSQASAVTGRINTDLATATPPTTELVTGYLEIWDQDDTDLLAQFGYDASNALTVRNKMQGGAVRLITTAVGGAETTLVQTLDATAGGLQVNNQLTAAGLERVLTESDKPTAGVNQGDMLAWDTGTSLYVPTSSRIQTFADGIKLFSDEAVAGLALTSVGNRIEFWDADQDSRYGYVGFGDVSAPESSTLALGSYFLNGSVQIRRTNASGTLLSVFSASSTSVTIGSNSTDIYFAPTGSVVFNVDASGFIQAFSSSLEVLKSTSQATGGLLINQTFNSNTGLAERALAEADLGAGYRLYMGWGLGNTSATDPGASLFRFNNANFSLATEMFISATDEANYDADVILGMVTTGDHIIVSDHKGRDEYLVMEVTGAPTDNLGWWTIPIAYLRGVTTFTSGSTNDPFIVEFTALGDLTYADPAGIVNVSGNWTVTGNWTFDNSLNDVLFEPLVSINMRNQSDTSQTFIQNLDGRLQFGVSGADFGSAYFDIGGASFAHTRTQPILISEKAAAVADVAAWGQVWVKNDVPNTLYFTDDTGVDYPVAGNGIPAGTFANTGFELRSAGNTDTEDRLIEFTYANSTVRAEVGNSSADGSTFRVKNYNGAVMLKAIDSGASDITVFSGGASATFVQGESSLNLFVGPAVGFETALNAVKDGAVTLYHNNLSRFATKASGVEVVSGGAFITEQAAASVDTAGQGQLWVKDSVANMLMFTDDTGVDHRVGVEIKVKTADESITNDANPNDSDDNHLTGFNVDAGGYYAIEGYLPYTQNGGDIQLQLTYTVSLTARAYSIFAVAEDGTTDEDTDNAGSALSITALTDGQDAAIHFKGFVIPASSGTAKLQWAQGTSSANATTIRQGAWMSFRRIQ